jgi:hypothetical protein
VYTYETSFNVASTTPIVVNVAADDSLTGVRVNGVAVAVPAGTGWSAFTPLTISASLLHAGRNTLDFDVTNGGPNNNPTGFRAEFTSPLADVAVDYRVGSINTPMTGVADTNGDGTWNYDLGQVNTDTNPTGLSGLTPLTYENNTNGGSGPYYGTNSSYTYDTLQLPAISNGAIFGTTPPADDYIQMHPGGDTNASVVEWTAGATESGTISVAFDFSRVGVPGSGLTGDQGYVDVGVYCNGSQEYSSNRMFLGSDTGPQQVVLTGVTPGTKVDFVVSCTGGVLCCNTTYLSAQIDPSP